jgi:hypothetical protein
MKHLITALLLCYAVLGLADNLIKNPDFSAEKKFMKDWTLTTMCDQVFDLVYNEESKFVDLESSGTEYSGYLNQIVPVKPDTRYLLKVTIRLVKGRALLWVVGLNSNRQELGYQQTKWLTSFVGHPLVPNFVRKEFVAGSGNTDWGVEELEFVTKKPEKSKEELAFVKINVGVYFSTGKIQVKKIELIQLDNVENKADKK